MSTSNAPLPEPPPPPPRDVRGGPPPLPPLLPTPPEDDSGDDPEFSLPALRRRENLERVRAQQATLLVVLLALALPFAGCGFLFAVCTVFGR